MDMDIFLILILSAFLKENSKMVKKYKELKRFLTEMFTKEIIWMISFKEWDVYII